MSATGLVNGGAASDEPEITDALKFEEEEIFSTDIDDNTEENQFDEMTGALQDILTDPEFVALQSDFCFRNCEVFENVTENKLIYTSIFNEYANLIESFFEQRLLEKLEVRQPNENTNQEMAVNILRRWLCVPISLSKPQYFSMDELVRQMQEHEDEIPLGVIDVLQSCFDFEEFKSLMLSFKQNETPNIEVTGDALIVCGSE